jgi:hypothetical protein
MMQRELSYRVPFGRLTKLSRSAGRKAYRTVWLLTWCLLAVLLAALVSLVVFGDAIDAWMRKARVPYGVEMTFVSVWLLFVAGILLLRRMRVRQLKDRADFDQVVRLTRDADGLRFATANIEYYLKWPGISQLLLEHDGVVISHGNLFFFVPSAAFTDVAERDGFIRDVYGRLSEKARSISEKHVRATLSDSVHPS